MIDKTCPGCGAPAIKGIIMARSTADPALSDYCARCGTHYRVQMGHVCEMSVKVGEFAKYTPQGYCRRCGLPRDVNCNCDAPIAPIDTKPANRCAEVLTKAFELTGGDRAKTHGDKRQNHQNIANLWNAYLGIAADADTVGVLARPLTAADVAILMCLLKIARMKSGTFNLDNFIDLAGYAGVAAECSDDQ